MTPNEIHDLMAEALIKMGMSKEKLDIEFLTEESVLGIMLGYLLARYDSLLEMQEDYEAATDMKDVEILAILKSKMGGTLDA